MTSPFEILGMAGIGLSVVAYLPQMTHLMKEHCAAGISTRSWQLWLISSMAVGALAVHRGDFVFITLAASSLLSAVVILILTHRYRGMECVSGHDLRSEGPGPRSRGVADSHVEVVIAPVRRAADQAPRDRSPEPPDSICRTLPGRGRWAVNVGRQADRPAGRGRRAPRG